MESKEVIVMNVFSGKRYKLPEMEGGALEG